MGVAIGSFTVGDEPAAWRAAGYAVDEAGRCRIGSVVVELVGRERGKRILGWSLRGALPGSLDDGSVDGLPTTAAADDDDPDAPGTHPNGALAIDHVVLLTPDLARTVAAIEALGCSTRGERDSDTYGAPMRQVFFRAGEVILEVVGSPDQAGQGDAGFFGLAVTVADLDATAALLGPALGQAKDAVQPGRRIATLRHRDVGLSVATAFMSPEPAPERG